MNQHVNIENDEVTIPYYAEHKNGQVHGFFGKFSFLSNFYILKVGVGLEDLSFPSVEHAFQAAKWPVNQRAQFLDCTAGYSKKLGRLAPNFNVKKWNKMKVELMRNLVFQKFEKNLELRKMLCAMEGYKLSERNSWNDQFWGTNEAGEGENHLGQILMNVRDKLIAMEKKSEW